MTLCCQIVLFTASSSTLTIILANTNNNTATSIALCSSGPAVYFLP